MVARKPVVWLLATALAGGAGCFRDPDLSACGEDGKCTESFPVCEDGLCFHHTFRYLVPPCSAEGGSFCCDLGSGRLDQDPNCILRSEEFPESSLSAPVLGEDGRFYFARAASDGTLHLLARSALGGKPGQDGYDVELASDLAEGILASAPSVASDGTLLVPAVDRLLLRDSTGKPWTGRAEGEIAVEGQLVGPVAFCDSGVVAWTTTDAVWLAIPGEDVVSLELAIGGPPAGVGVLYHTATERLLVPADDGRRLVCLERGDAQGTFSKKWELSKEKIPGGILGLALDGKGFAYVLSEEGTLRAFPMAEGPEANNSWTVDSKDGFPLAGPVLREPGEALMAIKNGGVYSAVEQIPGDVQLVRSGATFSQLVPLRQEGFAGLVEGDETLTFLVDSGASLLSGQAGDFRKIHWKGECQEPAMSLPSPQGAVAVTCGTAFTVLMAPEYPRPDFDWPAARGWGNRGCL